MYYAGRCCRLAFMHTCPASRVTMTPVYMCVRMWRVQLTLVWTEKAVSFISDKRNVPSLLMHTRSGRVEDVYPMQCVWVPYAVC